MRGPDLRPSTLAERGDIAVHEFTNRSIFASWLLIFILCGTAVASGPFTEMGVVRPRVRMDAPAFILRDIKGAKKGLSDFKGKVILLNFWATWCPSCREEMPSLEGLWEKFRAKGVMVIAVAVDRRSEEVESFARRLGLTFPILLDADGTVRRDYEVIALPMTYIIGKDGKISGRIFGSREWAGKDADVLVEQILRNGM